MFAFAPKLFASLLTLLLSDTTNKLSILTTDPIKNVQFLLFAFQKALSFPILHEQQLFYLYETFVKFTLELLMFAKTKNNLFDQERVLLISYELVHVSYFLSFDNKFCNFVILY